MSTEASYRFERGIDRWGGGEAMRRCIEIMLATAGGELAEAPARSLARAVAIRRASFSGPRGWLRCSASSCPGTRSSSYLVAIGATVVSKPDDGRIAVDVPGWRPDLVREIDLIEEIARLHGYDSFPSDLRPFRLGALPDAPIEEAAVAAVRRGMVEQGLLRGRPACRSARPTARTACGCSIRSRPTTPGSGGGCCPAWCGWSRRNWANHVADVRLFEIGTAFAAGGPGERPREERRVAAVLTGRREPRALDRQRRGPVRSLGSQGPVRGRGRSGDSGGRGAG